MPSPYVPILHTSTLTRIIAVRTHGSRLDAAACTRVELFPVCFDNDDDDDDDDEPFEADFVASQ